MSITLFIPGLSQSCTGSAAPPRYPALETLFARSHPQAAVDHNAVVAELFGLPSGFGAAPFMRLSDTAERDAGFYFCADPVHLAPDRDQLVMLPPPVLQVTSDEARTLAEAFDRTYANRGYRLETPYPGRWYLRTPSPMNCATHETALVAGRPVFEFMPQGEDGQRLRQLLNEVQMLFHDHPVNLARETAGRPVVNSLWLWGGGGLPQTSITGPDRVLTDMPLIAGLARFAGSRCSDRTVELEIPDEPAKLLIAYDCATDLSLMQLETQLAPVLLRALRQDRISELLIYPGNQRSYRLIPASLRRFWRRRQPLSEVLCAA